MSDVIARGDADAARRSYEAERAAFADEVAARGLGDVRDLLWYHTIDLGEGLVTPALYDLRALELRSLDELDRFHGEALADTVRKMTVMSYVTESEPLDVEQRAAMLYRTLLRAPFEFCAARLRSAVERRFMPVYEVSRAALGGVESISSWPATRCCTRCIRPERWPRSRRCVPASC